MREVGEAGETEKADEACGKMERQEDAMWNGFY